MPTMPHTAAWNLLLLNTGQDTAGGSIRTKQAFDRLRPDYTAHAMNAASPLSPGAYLAYPTDLIFGSKAVAKGWYDWADVVHIGNTLHGWEWFDNGQGKPTILHHHGTIFRDGHREISARARDIGAIEVCSTFDLTLLEPNVTWAPTPYDLAWLAGMRQPQDDDVIRIAHAPTNRWVKSTDAVIAAVASLKTLGYPVALDLIEGVSNAECLERKGRADIFVDQVILGYGCNAVEAWGMGLPVIAGVADERVRAAMLARWGHLPFYEATVATIADAILAMLDPATRGEWAQRGAEHVVRYHDERVVVAQLADIYANAGPTRTARRRQTQPVTGAERRAQAVAGQA